MSQQILVATTSSSSSAAPTLRYKNRQGILSYAQGSIAEFQKLEAIIDKTQWNVYEFVFDFRMEFCQKNQGNKCTVRYLPGGYAKPSFENKPNGMTEIFFEVTGIPECIFSGDVEQAKDFPLAKSVDSFTHVKIVFDWSYFVPKPKTMHQCRQVLSHLTTRGVTQLPEFNEAIFLKQMRDVSEAESKAQEKLLGTQKGCRIRTTRWRKTIVIQVWPGANQDNADL
ncbi:MAG: hypothetical protein ALECFALPRED_007443 [Alectoria fallacina]|uniref:Uncharacterized protein n=1 Tax=Alectoria fallacina TaxID=1903189 RepID=A0A8H3IY56_9LECA|nr:MAG: hypothetical protein ALECFALPRED_007443 [Alectoria fallacina]